MAALATCCSALANNRRFSEDPVGSACNINDGHIQEAGGMTRDQIVTDTANPRAAFTTAKFADGHQLTVSITGLQGIASAPHRMNPAGAAEINVGVADNDVMGAAPIELVAAAARGAASAYRLAA